MSKVRVHELAKELGKSSKDIIYALKGHGIIVESHMSTISTDSAEKIRKFYNTPAKSSVREDVKPAGNKENMKNTQEVKTESRPARTPEKTENRQAGSRFAGQKPENRENRGNRDNRDNRGNRDGNRSFGGSRDGGSRDNRDNRGNRDGNRNFGGSRDGGSRDNRDNRGNRDGNRSFGGSRDGGSRDNRDNRGNRDGNRSFGGNRDGGNRDNRGNRDGSRSFGGSRDGGSRDNRDNRGNRDGNRSFGGNRDGGSRDNRDNRGSKDNRSRGRDKDAKFNLDSAISKEVVVTKDSTRETRRNFKDKGSKDKNNRDRDNEKKGSKSFQLSKKPLTPPTAKPKPVVEKVTNIELPDTITLKELGDKMKISPSEIIKKLFMAGKIVTLNTEISYEEAEEIALEYDILCEHEVVVDVIEELLKEDEESEADLKSRPPVVCVMGHVDHGKTSILDAIRKTSVTTGEAGGITQHIGAYVVDVNGQKITFLDTPGHEAFTAMRLRGALATDIAILVVAADDGVMPQTIEAINHAKAAEIEIIVAINKIDKPSANIDRVKQELTEYGLIAEDWGGDTIMVPVSAHTREGLPELLDMILLVAEMRELKANPNRNARGLVIEAKLDKGRGSVATVLVQKGTLNVGDTIAVGTAYGRVRAMIDDKGRRVKKAGPSTPVEILGLNDVPLAGEVFVATDSEKEARAFAETFIANNREKMLADTKSKLSLDGLFDQIQAGQIKDLNIVVKADVQGSVEAVKQSLVKLSNDEVAVKVIHGGVGAINESDVTLASASNAIIIGFNVRPDNTAKQIAEQENVDVRLYRVIYNAIEDVEAAMKGLLDPTFEERIIGHAEVRQTYKVSGVGTIIGGYVLDGKVLRGCKARLLRDNIVIHEGELASLKRFKDDVKEVNAGYECGMSFEKYNDIKEGDKIEMFVMEEVER